MNGFDASQALVWLHSQGIGLVLLLALASVRCFVLFMVLPATGEEAIPGAARNGVVYLLGGFVAYGQPPDLVARMDPLSLFALVGKEAFVGLMIGYAASSIFWVAQNVGTVIDDLAGFNNVQMSNPLRGDQSTPVSNTILQTAITLFYVLGGMSMLLGAVFESYRWWPLATLHPDGSQLASQFVLQSTDNMMTATVKLSAPVMLVLVLVDLGFGLVARSAEKLEPSNLSQPVRGALALLMLALLMQVFVSQLLDELSFVHFQAKIGQFLSASSATH
ncbi:type III secretion system export apparatus subunit SctT [Xanthomonas graminis]|jgi:type III secretion protein T|uniref:Type III secretion system protein HrcT n=1 Tax=Xanthomonas graminis pv. graminis TaxID=134874 RepID=A0A1M4IF13_9XANT|nr:type III secretion system export apparatus subunit SctT [Xanthomonas translucens]EKU26005.1 type III secretory pathway component [Xanthomonas translucens pv. graminis ART-Xtg29]OAX62445.1 EscT/YscT/HrcT family type III secretion system export apparatus protein [Xanthomonas translucens pv. graminis]UKE53495.1 type III secretion system export apparatus subunit SctT [Xanthomonas translucens pv. graminis]WIH07813.1 type III secretion system export apparatus subunit SctT [Xanthomonas translucens 